MSIKQKQKKNEKNDFHKKSCGPILEELRLRKVRCDLHLAHFVGIARENVLDRDLQVQLPKNDGGGWKVLEKSGTENEELCV